MSDVREAFEQWAKDNWLGGGEDFHRRILSERTNDGQYKDRDLRVLFIGYKAALQQTAPAVPEGVKQALECFEIARFEGWDAALEEGNLPVLRDIYYRRISWAEKYLQEMEPDHSPDAGKVAVLRCSYDETGCIERQWLEWKVRASDLQDLTPLYTHPTPQPVQSENEVKAQALETYADQLDAVFERAQEAHAVNCPAWHAGQFAKDARKQAARLRGDKGVG